ncbi:MAG: glycosyltransferase family 39 protein, partial [Sedimenticolaceae bacterium]
MTQEQSILDGPKVQWSALALIVVAGAIVRLWGLGDASLWLDEAASVQFAGLPWSTLWLTGYDNAPPLYYSVLKVVLFISDSEFAVRLPSLVFGVLTIPVVYWAGRLVAGPQGALAAALVFALSAAQVEYSQEARAYSLLVFALALALVGLLQFFGPVVK